MYKCRSRMSGDEGRSHAAELRGRGDRATWLARHLVGASAMQLPEQQIPDPWPISEHAWGCGGDETATYI